MEDIILALVIYSFSLCITILSGRYCVGRDNSGKVIWERDGGFSTMWVNLRQENHYKLLNLLFYRIESLDTKKLRVPLWSIILKSNFYLQFVLLIVGTILTRDFFFTMAVVGYFLLSSIGACFVVLQFVDYLLWRFNGREDKYIENVFSFKVLLIYIIVQLIALLIMIVDIHEVSLMQASYFN